MYFMKTRKPVEKTVLTPVSELKTIELDGKVMPVSVSEDMAVVVAFEPSSSLVYRFEAGGTATKRSAIGGRKEYVYGDEFDRFSPRLMLSGEDKWVFEKTTREVVDHFEEFKVGTIITDAIESFDSDSDHLSCLERVSDMEVKYISSMGDVTASIRCTMNGHKEELVFFMSEGHTNGNLVCVQYPELYVCSSEIVWRKPEMEEEC